MNTGTMRGFGSPLLLLLGLLLPAPAGAQHFPPDEDLALMLRYLVEDGETPGIVLGVLEADGTARAVGYGSAGPEARPPGPRSVFEIGSLTMTFTATVLADMVARGEVGLEDPVAKYLPDHVTVPSLGGYEITLGDLATHRSGLPPGPPGPYADVTVDDLYDLVAGSELERPGRRYAFSHLGYALLGHALARAVGTSYHDLLRERVLDPLGMDMTGYTLEGEAAEWMAQGHADGAVVSHSFVTEAMQGATGLRSSAQDMLRFLRANVGPSDTELARAMRQAREIRVERGREDEAIGFGFSWRTYAVAPQRSVVAHGGGAGGFTSLITFDPEKGIGTVVLANTRAFNDRIGRALVVVDPPVSRGAARVDPALLGPYEGTYRSIGRYRANLQQGRYFIRLEDEGYLTYQARGVVRTRLYAESDSTFYMLRGPYTVTFSRQGDDVRMVLRVDERKPHLAGRSRRAWKVAEDTPPPAVVARNVAVWATWGPGTWALIGLLGAAALAAVLRPLWSRQSGRVVKPA